jgi:hypothetical protein
VHAMKHQPRSDAEIKRFGGLMPPFFIFIFLFTIHMYIHSIIHIIR